MTKQLLLGIIAWVMWGSMAAAWAATDSSIVYDAPQGAELLSEYRVEVCSPCESWQTVPTYAVKVAEGTLGHTETRKVSMAYFDFSGEVRVRVTKLKQDFDSVSIRPLSYDITYAREGRTIEFTLRRPMNLSIDFDGQIFNNLHLFANPILESRPDKNAPRTIYFGPGIHRIEGDTLRIPSGWTVFIDGGAIVKGQLRVEHATDVNIYGRGEIHPDGRGEGIVIANSERVSVSGVIVTQCPVGGSKDIKINNVKAISSYGWGDGLNVFASQNVSYDSVFCRTSDDCTTVYATRKGFTGGCKNIRMTNSTLWADVAHPIFIGLHGNSEHPDTIENVTYDNIDILDENEFQTDYQGCMAINAGDNNMVRSITFRNIRIESLRRGQILSLRVSFNKKYCTAPGRGIEDVKFENIEYNGLPPETSLIIGYNEERRISGLSFKGLKINGLDIYDTMPEKPKWYKTSDMARFFIGEHVDGVRFD